jgi:peptidoglycan/xylan/chitin deacetylase (PgdA/CDA1 family)/glycosyltransferase involved in cell wall biosynthesis
MTTEGGAGSPAAGVKPDGGAEPLLSVVMATYNRGELLRTTLPTLLRQQEIRPDQYEIVIVVDGSTDDTVAFLAGISSDVPLRIHEQPNRGQAAAQNVGIQHARGRLILFLDDDMLCGPRLIARHARRAPGSGNAVLIGPILVADESPDSIATEWMRRSTRRFVDRIAAQRTPEWPADAIIYPNISVPRADLIAAGGFNEDMSPGCPSVVADVELGLRLWQAGLQFRFEPEAVARQVYVKSASSLVRTDARQFGMNEVALCRRFPAYRPHSSLARYSAGPRWKQLYHAAAARSRPSPEPLLRLASHVAERLGDATWARSMAVRLLETRQGVARGRGAVAAAGSWRQLRAEFGMRLPVLLYHHVGPRRPDTYRSLTVEPDVFERQMRMLAGTGYSAVTPDEWLGWALEGRPLPDRPVLITFDDGYADLARYAFPVLERYRLSATVFIVTSQLGGTNVWDDPAGFGGHRLLDEPDLVRWAGKTVSFGSHGRSHADLRTLSDDELTRDLAESAAVIEALTGRLPDAFAYPYGFHDERVRRAAAERYRVAFGVSAGVNGLGTDLADLRRLPVWPRDGVYGLRSKIMMGFNPAERIRTIAVRWARGRSAATR